MLSLEGKSFQLDGNYLVRTNAIYKCYKAARERGWSIFAVANGGECRGSPHAADIYKKNGMSSKCSNMEEGKGDPGSSNVYFVTGEC